MFKFIANILGKLMRILYDNIATNFTEPKTISFYAIAIIIMTLLVSLISIPVTISTQKQAEKTRSFKPKMDEIQKKYGYDQQVLQKKMQELYKQEGVTPGLSGCLPMIIQLLVLFGLFEMMRNTGKYVFPEGLNHIRTDFYWVPDLLKADPLWFGLPLLTSLSQLLTTLFSIKTNPQQQQAMGSMNTMMLVLPLVFFFTFRQLPAGLPLYYTLSSVFRLLIMVVMHLAMKGKKVEEK
ncbi:YidC/Oxa1 family membrane protein insertase [Anaerococcus lactolyticus]|uniref:Membrane protein insertase, YidC/Oxa1 family n=2 Tax=Anaerococcus lactolyticus TaxID=33032 RepID=C2BFN6_9FIRM|nr:YidC/Oxa1 family membrane protein insertase [Anaerococcus lactolyticus]EEI86323.1 membrane protein insertase, YidC/Oxa1 family [Anaerococcus lactolyticus ATCC 51172]KGF05348.1 membrane protein [Anaerococcus lactolyticus S7-1-13]